ncbi:MAG TPA: hypothetical protein VMB52_01390 [Verrucomicrobiae bacterium]|nr:hypothetical protein [Verrucomicrobiae bacterium]
MPRFLFTSNEGGVSNYGVYTLTIAPYTLAFGLCGICMIQTAQILPTTMRHRRTLQWLIAGIGWLYLLALESTYPYQVNGIFDALHVGIGVALFLAQSMGAVWIMRAYKGNGLRDILFGMQMLGLCLLILTFFGFLHVLLVAEVLTGASFGALLIQTLSVLDRR